MTDNTFADGAGVEGGFDVGEKKYDIEELCSVLVMPGWHEFPLSFPGLPEKVCILYLIPVCFILS